MHTAPILLGTMVLATAAAVTRGVARRRRAERRARWLDVLGAAARRERPLAPVLKRAAEAEASPRRRAALLDAGSRIEAGESLADALSSALPREIPASVAASIRGADGTARLPEVLDGLATEAGRDLALAHRAAMATTYPAILGAGLLILHLTILEGSLASAAYASDRAADQTSGAAPLVAARFIFVAIAAALTLPWLWSRLRRVAPDAAAARWLRTMAWTLGTGRGLPEALRRAAGAASHRGLRRASSALAQEIQAGRPLQSALSTLPLPARVRARLQSLPGGPAPAFLHEIADFCEKRHAARGERWIRWAVPVATVVVGLVIAVDYAVVMDVWQGAAMRARP